MPDIIMKIKINCKTCGKEFETPPCRLPKRKYCCKDCYSKDITNILGNMVDRACLYCGKKFKTQPKRKKRFCSLSCSTRNKWSNPEYRDSMSEKHKGQTSPMRGKKHSDETKEKLRLINKGQTPWNKGKGKATEYQRFKKDKKHAEWREAIFKRDNYTCQICHQRGVKIQADHIKPYSIYPELRLDLNNGRTLCESCHRKTDTYGGRAVKMKKQMLK